MFDIGWPELVIVLIVAIVVIGPRDLPKAFYTVGKWVKAARRVTSDFQRHVDDMMRETELEDLRKVANQARGLNVKNQIAKAIDPTGDLKSALDVNIPIDGKSKTTIPTPSVPTPPGPSVPVGTKTEEPAANAAPSTPAKPAAKPVAKKVAGPRKSSDKPSPRVPSRVPKRNSQGGTTRKPSAAKVPKSEKTS